MPAPSIALITGPTGCGKTTALQHRYYELIQAGVRSDQILVLVSGAAQAVAWKRALKLEAAGPLEIYGYFGFVQRELTLFWAAAQAAEPALGSWLRPQFLNVEVAHHLMRARVDAAAAEFTALKASAQRIAIQVVSNLATVAAASCLTPAEAAERLAAAHGRDKAALYATVLALLEGYRDECRRAGLLDYALALDLYQRRLLPLPAYRSHLFGRYRHLLVDDLDETAPAEQDCIAALSEGVASTTLAFGPDGGHAAFMGARPDLALARFGGAARQDLQGSHTCSPAMLRLGEDLVSAIRGERPTQRHGDVLQDWIHAELRSTMLEQAVDKAVQLLDLGVPPGEIALLAPHVDTALAALAGSRLARRGVPVFNLSLSRRLIDEPIARTIVTLAALVHPQWQSPLHAGAVATSLAVLLRLDAIRCALLGEEIARRGALPDLDESGLRRRVGFERSEAYEILKRWVEAAQDREWATDAFAQAVVSQVLLPLLGELTPEQRKACQQLLLSAHRFRLALERFGAGAYGSHYIKLLTEGTVAAEPLQAYAVPDGHVLLATPFAYISARRTSEYQIWLDISGGGWYPSDVKELANPHVLSPAWPAEQAWTDSRSRLARQANAARTARALVRRCRGRLVLAECDLGAWGEELQGGGLAAAFSEVIRSQVKGR